MTTVHRRSLCRPRRSYLPHMFNIASLSASKLFVFVSGYPPAACSLSVLTCVQFWRDSQRPHCACALSPHPPHSVTTLHIRCSFVLTLFNLEVKLHIAHMFTLQLLTTHKGFSRYMYKAHHSRVMLLIYQLKPKGAVNNCLLARLC